MEPDAERNEQYELPLGDDNGGISIPQLPLGQKSTRQFRDTSEAAGESTDTSDEAMEESAQSESDSQAGEPKRKAPNLSEQFESRLKDDQQTQHTKKTKTASAAGTANAGKTKTASQSSSQSKAKVMPVSKTVQQLLENIRAAARNQGKVIGPIEITIRGSDRYREGLNSAVEMNTLSDQKAELLRSYFGREPISRPIANRELVPKASIRLAGEEVFRVEGVGVVQNALKGYLPPEQAQTFNAAEAVQTPSISLSLPSDWEQLYDAERSTIGHKWSKESKKERMRRSVESFSVIQHQRIAGVTTQLLQAYGTRQDDGRFVLQTKDYTLEGQGRELVIKTSQGKELFKRIKSPAGLSFVSFNHLSPQQAQDFLIVDRLIRQEGIAGISPDSAGRLKQLGSLTPQFDTALSDQINARRIRMIGRAYLDVEGAVLDKHGMRAIESHPYRIEESKTGIKITAHRPDGQQVTIVQLDNGKSLINLTTDDLKYFSTLATDLSGRLVQQNSVAQAMQSVKAQATQMQR
ncbi:hypothetical protein Lepto7375DRAFT_0092 [Leptolyngbya sp. PCC 7375]|nr:hypothetical protein Lepto7375DRAFT_0092 [Leptolyngbya sp. PCC 7375]